MTQNDSSESDSTSLEAATSSTMTQSESSQSTFESSATVTSLTMTQNNSSKSAAKSSQTAASLTLSQNISSESSFESSATATSLTMTQDDSSDSESKSLEAATSSTMTQSESSQSTFESSATVTSLTMTQNDSSDSESKSSELAASLTLSDASEYLLKSADRAISLTITQRQMYQTRLNFGVNLGSVFLREEWIYPSFFKGGQKTEFDIISSFKKNKEKGRREMEAHWTSYFLDEDWDWLARNKVNSLRLPIGFWNIDGGTYTTGTIFEEYSEMYRNSLLIIKSHYIEPAARRGISILIDVHGVPGGANDNDHSGAFYGGATFWTTPSFQELFIKAAVFLFEDLKEYDNISGILLINEASYNFNLQQQNFYAAAINAIREKERTIPVVISDGWNADSWIRWVSSNQNPKAPAGMVVDHHVYRTFTDKDKERSADEIIAGLNHDLLPSVNDDGNHVDFMVGEWSSVMDGQTWARTNGVITPSDDNDPRRRELVAEFNSKQMELFRKRASTGSYFWTYKFESGYGGEWDFRQQLGRGFTAPQVSVPDDSTFKRTLERDYTAHKNYWDSQYPNGKFEHERYKEGFITAWEDGVTYAKAGALVGRKHAIKSVRLQEHLQRKGYLENIWEWKQGFDKGLEEFNKNAI